jgi:hypothetical protein
MNIKNRFNCLSEIDFNPKEINIPSSFSWIKNLEEFKLNFDNQNWKLRPQYVRLYNFLSRIQERYCDWQDPINYLYYLYYEVKLSSLDIEKELWHLWNYSPWVIWKMMKKILLWELRWTDCQNYKTDLRTEKDQNKVKWLNEKQRNEKVDNVIKVENILKRISKNKEKKDFSQDIFSELKNIRTKAQYILAINWYIHENLFVENLVKLSDKYGMKVTAQAITNLLEQETTKIWNIDKIELRAGRIREIKNEQN